MIEALAIEFENILCFKDRQRFKFAKNNIHLITGKNLDFFGDNDIEANNGIGKSALATLIRFALFGFAKDTNKNILINKDVGKNLRVRFEFKIKDDFYAVERYKKHDKFKDELFLFKNDEDISASNKTQTQQDIIELLVITDDTFLKCSLFTREDNPQFLSLTLSERSKIFENIIHLSKFKKYFENVKNKKKSYTKYLSELEIELKSEQKNLVNLTNLLQNQYFQIKEKRANIISQIKNYSPVDEDTLKCYNKYKELLSNIESFNSKIKIENESIDNLKKHNKEKELELKIIEKKINSIKEIIEEKQKNFTCEKCGHISDKVKEQINKLYLDIEKLEKTKPIVENLFLIEHASKERIKTYEERIQRINNNLEKLNITQNIIDIIENKNDKAIEILNNQLLKENYNQCKILLEKIRKTRLNVSQLTAQKNDIQKTLNYCDKAIKLLDINEEDSIKQHILSEIVPVFNNILQKNIDYIYENTMVINFDNNLNETIIYKDKEFDFFELSTGEKTRLDLCISFSILELTRLYLGGFNILFLDEVFSNIDEYFIIKFLKMIEEKYQDNTAIYIISHSAGLRENAKFSSIINLTMKNGSSTFTIENQ